MKLSLRIRPPPVAFVLTGTPIESRLDELYSLMDFLNPALLGPLFRFNREYYQLGERGRPEGYCNLDKLNEHSLRWPISGVRPSHRCGTL
jgi:SNF2 family DNA or RNA helicase